MRYVLDTPPDDLISLAEAKAHLRITGTDEDSLITALVAAATEHFDGRTGILGRAIMAQTWRLEAAGPVCGKIAIDMPDVTSIDSVTYLSSGVETTWGSSEYRLGANGALSFVEPASGTSWPAADDREDAFRVTFVAGWADTGSVPAPIKSAVLLLVGQLYRLGERNLFLAREEVPGVMTRQFVVSSAANDSIARAIGLLTDKYRVRSI